MPMKIALYGGTFNPPHFGHVRLLEAFCREIAFDKVLIVPDKRPVHKICEDLALDSERLDMCRLAFPDPQYEVSDMEITRRRTISAGGDLSFDGLGYVFVVP